MAGPLLEGRRMTMSQGIGEEYPEFHRASEGCAKEAVETCEIDLEKGVDAVLAPSAP
jgi:hypothetical protein